MSLDVDGEDQHEVVLKGSVIIIITKEASSHLEERKGMKPKEYHGPGLADGLDWRKSEDYQKEQCILL